MTSIFTTLKSHHEGVNAAVETIHPTTTPTTTTTTTQPQPPTNLSKAWHALKRTHNGLNTAFSVYYSPSHTPAHSRSGSIVGASPRHSAEEEAPCVAEGSSKPAKPEVGTEAHAVGEEGKRNYQKLWKGVKDRVVAHHRGVESACEATWGYGGHL
ncbi:hypothetical protein BDW02DRAFT_573005 [Decorospora gaudefroyi]|uniref:Uncharacterized protein n=1 Tax=Decorospora gaudefroyi TaxID=184978 RepID=A0A6A5K7M1_9PLEO|nr:hypothetical protein BDW02DRAFT_573005 [Decorospora gaudefroyi]